MERGLKNRRHAPPRGYSAVPVFPSVTPKPPMYSAAEDSCGGPDKSSEKSLEGQEARLGLGEDQPR